MSKWAQYKVGRDYVHIPGGFGQDWATLQSTHPNPACNMVLLDDAHISVLLSLISILKFQWLWGFPRRAAWSEGQWVDWDNISAFVAEMEHQLMTACSTHGIEQQLALLRAGLLGEIVDLDNLTVSGVVDYTEAGLLPRLEGALGDIEDNSDDAEAIMDNISTILGAAAILGV